LRGCDGKFLLPGIGRIYLNEPLNLNLIMMKETTSYDPRQPKLILDEIELFPGPSTKCFVVVVVVV
jgi:hypothetical protein